MHITYALRAVCPETHFKPSILSSHVHANQVMSVAFTQSGVHQRDPTCYMKGHENICNLFGVTMIVTAAVVHVELMPQGEG